MKKSVDRAVQGVRVAVALICSVCLAGAAGDGGPARAEISSGGISFSLRAASHNGGKLTVGCGDTIVEQEFSPGETPSFDLRDANMPDGSCQWELSFNASEVAGEDDGASGRRPQRQRLSRSRFANQRPEGAGSLRQSGSFRVQHRSIVTPGAVEPGGGR